MMSTNNFGSSSPSYPARQQNSQYSPYVSPSVRQQGQRFTYHAPSPFPRPRSSASKPNPDLSDDNISYTADNRNVTSDCYYKAEESFTNNNINNNYGSSADETSSRFNNSVDYGSPSSEYYSCNEDSFRTPMTSPHNTYQSSAFTGTQNQQYSPFFNAGFGGSSTTHPSGGYQGSSYSGTPVQQKKKTGFGQRRFAPGRNGVPAGQKRGATSEFPYQGNSGGFENKVSPNSPAKKPRIPVRCEICNIQFTSDIPYKMHIAGAKHMKKVKSKEVLETMENQGQIPQAKDNYYYCALCQVMANSSQQLQMHLDGIKHKNKIRKLTESEEGVKTEGPPPPAKNDSEPVKDDDIGPKPAKITKFYCDVCSLSLNSENQLTQHLLSRRHEAKIKGEPLPVKKKARKFTDAPTNGNETSDEAAPSETADSTEETGSVTKVTAAAVAPTTAATQKSYGVQKLGSSFVPGGVLQ